MAIGSSQWMYNSGNYEIEQSLRFEATRGTTMSWQAASTGNRRIWTCSLWVKVSGDDNDRILGCFNGSQEDSFNFINGQFKLYVAGANNYGYKTTSVYRDPSAWYHLVVSVDTTQATAANRVKFYVNGEQHALVAVSGLAVVPQNYEWHIGGPYLHALGYDGNNATTNQSYLAEINMINGQALTPSSFGETGNYGEWKPLEYKGTYGTNGFYLPFKQDYAVEGFSAVTYEGRGVGQYIGGTGFSPSLTWIKARNQTYDHHLFDVIRGPLNRISSNSTNAESSMTNSLAAFNTDGFTLGDTAQVNLNNGDFVAWNWDMGGTTASNTNGSITSSVRANTTYGQSIVSYSGASNATTDNSNNGGSYWTIGHGLSQAPELVLVKTRNGAAGWYMGHQGLSSTPWQSGSHVVLNTTAANANEANILWGNTAPTSTVFTAGGWNVINRANSTYIAYCFHSVAGYSKFGSYTGNGNTTGPVVTLGFAPAFLLVKSSTAVEPWNIIDNTRNPTNPKPSIIQPNSNGAEVDTASGTGVDFTSTGFQIKTNIGNYNTSGQTYIYMAFADTREYAYWLDQSGNNNDWTSNNLTESDVMVDSPTNNFATMNPNASGSAHEPDTNTYTTKNGNLESKWTGTASAKSYATMAPTDGKWYWEFFIKTQAETARSYVGLCEFEDCDINGTGQSGDSNYHLAVGNYSRLQAYGNEFDNVYPAPSQYDVYSIAIDWSASPSKFWFRINGGAWQGGGNPATGATPTKSYNKTIANASMMPYHGSGSGSASNVSEIVFNFGSDSSFAGNKTSQGNQDSGGIGDFYYAPPTGYLALCTANLPSVDVIPSENFNTVLYTADDSSDHDITGVGFQPDFVFIKGRESTADGRIYDAVRGANKTLTTTGTYTEFDESTASGLTSFDADGFNLGSNNGSWNAGSRAYVAWNWKAGGSAVSNTNGSITSSVSANVDAGFSIATYTAGDSDETIGHGLSIAPEVVIVKRRDNATGNWVSFWTPITSTNKQLYLNLANAVDTPNLGTFNATTFRVNGWADVAVSGSSYVAYCFHSVDGYSKVGTYTGNGSATDGTFVYCGFRPAFLLVKVTNTASDWHIVDSARDVDNVIQNTIDPNTSSAEGSGNDRFDFTSNGFKLRQTSGSYNGNGNTYVYLAFAETPFKYSNAR
jgi:hypothetical protein